MDVKGQAAIITGGGSGLGETTARALAAAGCKVALFDVVADAAERVAKDIGGGGRISGRLKLMVVRRAGTGPVR